jgi:hypothetical protein
MNSLVFFSRCTSLENKTINIEAPSHLYLLNIYKEIKEKYKIDTYDNIQLKIFAANNKGKIQTFGDTTKIETMGEMIENKEIRHFEVFWKSPSKHGNQQIDLSSSTGDKVIMGYKRQIAAKGDTTIVGDINAGCYITIPKGAISEDTEFKIQMLEVDSNKINNGMTNVTQSVISDAKNANKSANNYK